MTEQSWDIPSWVVRFASELRSVSGQQPGTFPRVFPVENLKYGDLTSDLAFTLAAQYLCSPSEVAEELRLQLPGELSECCRVERGYLNVTIPIDALWRQEPIPVPARRGLTIVLPLFDSRCSFFKYCTVVAAAVIHRQCAAVLGIPVELVAGVENPGVIRSAQYSLGDWFRSSLQAGVREARVGDMDSIRWPLFGKSYGHTFFWGNTELVSAEIQKRMKNSAEERFSVLYPEDRNLLGCEGDIELTDLLRWSDDELGSFVVCVLRGEHFDPLSCKLAERLNIPWFCGSLLDRLLRYRHLFASPGREPGVPLTSQSGALLVRPRLLPLAVLDAALYGSVAPLVRLVTQISDSCSTFFNNPSLRSRLDRAEVVQPLDQTTLSGFARALEQFQEIVSPGC